MHILFKTLLFLTISVNAFANDALLNKASREFESDPSNAVQILRSNSAKFKTINEQMNLGNWYFTHGFKSDALAQYEYLSTSELKNIDAHLNKQIILAQKLAIPPKQIYNQLISLYESAVSQKNARYFDYIGYLALSFDFNIAKDAFEHSIMYSDNIESCLGLGLALEKINPVEAAGYYSNLLNNNILTDSDRSIVMAKLKGFQK